VVDHPKRDLPGAVMLGYQLARRGVSVVLVPMYEQAGLPLASTIAFEHAR
jgi:hypothetical protein